VLGLGSAMSSPDLATVVIACPNCGTRYQVPYATIGAAGREVQCAQCSQPWHAMADEPAPEPVEADRLFTPADEAALDAAFEAEAHGATPPALPAAVPIDADHQRMLDEIRAAIAPKRKAGTVNALDPALLKKSRRDFDQRQQKIFKRLPMARMRRTARLGALVALLSLLLLGFSLRSDLVRWFPSLAGLYATLGLPVNIVGLEFENTKTLTTLRDGKPVMQVTAKIRSISSQPVQVPPVLVSLLDAHDMPVYEWTVTPQAGEMDPGDVLDFTTEVNAPPDAATTVRLSFTDPHGGTNSAPTPVKAP